MFFPLLLLLLLLLPTSDDRLAAAVGLNIGSGSIGATLSVREVGSAFYYEECGGSIGWTGVSLGCTKKWKPLFYILIFGGLGIFIIAMSIVIYFCCCRNRQPAAQAQTSQQSRVVEISAVQQTPLPHQFQQFQQFHPTPQPPHLQQYQLQPQPQQLPNL